MPARRTEETGSAPSGLPRTLLVPYVLLFLKNWSAHGYQILQTLTALGFAAVDPATVYRTLRQMEKEGLVLSGWETSLAGPARRTYQITASGEAFLGQWAEALGSYQRFLDRFFSLYSSGGAAPVIDEPGATDEQPVEKAAAVRAPGRNGAGRSRRTRKEGPTDGDGDGDRDV